ncbi:MAG: DUF4097 family beta strand repeat-containing protein [Saccharofermentanales bacterium]
MTIGKKVFINIAVGIILIGLALMIAGWALGGRMFNFDMGGRSNATYDYQGIESIDIDIDAGTLLIKSGDKFTVETENVYLSSFSHVLEDGVLTITYKVSKTSFNIRNFHFGFFPWTNPKSVITVYLPEGTRLENSDLTIGAGRIEAESLDTEAIHIKVGAGEATFTDLKAQDANLDCGVGSIKITGEITGDSIVKCGVGQISLDLKGDPEDYDYKVKVGLGSTQINDDTYSGSTDKTETNEGATGSFDLDCGVGEIKIHIAE